MPKNDSSNETARFSFSQFGEKRQQLSRGPTGITATTPSASKPTSEVSFNTADGYNGSKQLFENIDLIGKNLYKINDGEEEVEEIEEPEAALAADEILKWGKNLLLEEELNLNKEQFLSEASFPPQNNVPTNNTKKDNFCRSCGVQYFKQDNFCGSCGLKRN